MTSIGDVGRAGTVSGGVVRVKSDTYCILNTVAILLSGVITWQVCNNTCPVFKLVKA